MKQSQFEKLTYVEKLRLIYEKATKLDSLIPWTGKIRLATFYSFSDFFIEILLDIKTEKINEINTFNDIEFLNKYPQYLDNINRNLNKELKLQN